MEYTRGKVHEHRSPLVGAFSVLLCFHVLNAFIRGLQNTRKTYYKTCVQGLSVQFVDWEVVEPREFSSIDSERTGGDLTLYTRRHGFDRGLIRPGFRTTARGEAHALKRLL